MDDEIEIKKILNDEDQLSENKKNCVHIKVQNKNYQEKKPNNVKVNINFKYELDPFQKEACKCIDKEESVLVAAHTSAGKTTVADYAVQSCIDNNARVIYTSPIKALSNQKYRDMLDTHGDLVGLITGDVTYNPDATVMVMTTEILTSMLFRGSHVFKEVKWVIFDEIHYMRDRERGVVWEETIILLSDTIRMVFLSATIPNSLEFAEWIVTIKNQPCNVIATNFRPTQLQHYVYTSGSDGIVLIQNESTGFLESNFEAAMTQFENEIENQSALLSGNRKKKRANQDTLQGDIEKLVKMCVSSRYTPIIIFAFSKRDVENYAQYFDKLDLTSAAEKADIREIFESAIATLSTEDQKLPYFETHLNFLLRGIGIHHGGLLPIIKEITEILFQETMLKILFSTETFSMGINMPARTVIFTGIHKFDGEKQRMISSGEYIQMAGRAGRRGIDDRGYSIVMINTKINANELSNLYQKEALRLDSQFYLKYNTILNLLLVQGIKPEYMLNRSFLQFQTNKNLLRSLHRLNKMKKKIEDYTIEFLLSEIATETFGNESNDHNLHPRYADIIPTGFSIEDSDEIEMEISDFLENLINYAQTFRQISHIEQNLGANYLKYLNYGRVVYIMNYNTNDILEFPSVFGYAIVISVSSKKMSTNDNEKNENTNKNVDIVVRALVHIENDNKNTNINSDVLLSDVKPHHCMTSFFRDTYGIKTIICNNLNMRMEVIEFPLSVIVKITKFKLKLDGSMTNENYRISCGLKLLNLLQKNDFRLDAIEFDSSILSEDAENYRSIMNKQNDCLSLIKNSKFYGWMYVDKIVEKSLLRSKEIKNLYELEKTYENSKNKQNESQLYIMIEILRELKYIDKNNVPTQKGRLCCDISAADTLVMGELLFGYSNLINLEPGMLAAIFSTFVADEKVKDECHAIDPKMIEYHSVIVSIAEHVAEVSAKCGLDIDPKTYITRFQTYLMKPAYDWINDVSFLTICKETDLYEGSLVRSFKRLEEVLREACVLARNMGSSQLEKVILTTLLRHKKGIIFANSLYLA